MKINVYYGGRGLLDDPTLYVLKKMEDVLRELRVNIEPRFLLRLTGRPVRLAVWRREVA